MSRFGWKEAMDCFGSLFRLSLHDGNEWALQTVDVQGKGGSARNEQFSLVFRGAAGLYLPQGVYELRHDKLGTVHWLLVPIGKQADGYFYEAAFHAIPYAEEKKEMNR